MTMKLQSMARNVIGDSAYYDYLLHSIGLTQLQGVASEDLQRFDAVMKPKSSSPCQGWSQK